MRLSQYRVYGAMREALSLCAFVALIAGCSFDRTGVAVVLDAGVDAGVRDAGPRDGGMMRIDSGPPDSGVRPSCDMLYGSAAGYTLCAERVDECEFEARLSTTISCGDVCTGGRCIEAYDNLSTMGICTRLGALGCAHVGNNANICVCSR